MLLRIAAIIGFALSLLAGLSPANAAKTCTCSFSSGTLAFGNYTFNGATVNATGSIVVSCIFAGGASKVIYTLALSGTNNRNMGASAPFLQYALYEEIGHNTPWQGTNLVTVTQTTASKTTSVYGQVPTGQNISAGARGGNPNPTISLTKTSCT